LTVETDLYLKQLGRWPKEGRHILAQFDDRTVIVYQAFRPEIGRFAAEHGYFGGPFSFQRMSWIKPNFLWMMYRSGWATKKDQETILAVHLRREAFDQILATAVHSSFLPEIYHSPEQWERAVAQSSVRLQWDPDHEPSGKPLERRALQLGLRGSTLRQYAREWIVRIEDITDFVHSQHQELLARGRTSLLTPSEAVYPVLNPKVAANLGISSVA
jgi:hypothetical protein